MTHEDLVQPLTLGQGVKQSCLGAASEIKDCVLGIYKVPKIVM
jgi:hypothetical protein